jgi:uncharacterized protein
MERHRIGLISDTHGLARPEALVALAGVEIIVHAGDVGSSTVLEALRTVAPLRAVRGNTDIGSYSTFLSGHLHLEIGGVKVYILHNLERLAHDQDMGGSGVVIFGHTHRAQVYQREGVLYVNPGSAGPRRGDNPVTVALLTIEDGQATAQIVYLTVDGLS